MTEWFRVDGGLGKYANSTDRTPKVPNSEIQTHYEGAQRARSSDDNWKLLASGRMKADGVLPDAQVRSKDLVWECRWGCIATRRATDRYIWPLYDP
jgi:hypothetical protein